MRSQRPKTRTDVCAREYAFGSLGFRNEVNYPEYTEDWCKATSSRQNESTVENRKGCRQWSTEELFIGGMQSKLRNSCWRNSGTPNSQAKRVIDTIKQVFLGMGHRSSTYSPIRIWSAYLHPQCKRKIKERHGFSTVFLISVVGVLPLGHQIANSPMKHCPWNHFPFYRAGNPWFLFANDRKVQVVRNVIQWDRVT